MNKKLLVATVLTGALLAGCGEESTEDKSAPKTEASTKPAADKEKETSSEVKGDERTVYVKKINPEIEKIVAEYDKIWTKWKPAMSGLSNGSVSLNDALATMSSIETDYQALMEKAEALDGSKLNEDNEMKLRDFSTDLSAASSYRAKAAGQAVLALKSGDVAKEKLAEVQSLIEKSNDPLLRAVASWTTLKMAYDVE